MFRLMKLYDAPLQRCIWKPWHQINGRVISTSNKNRKINPKSDCSEGTDIPWVSYGFDYNDPKDDTDNHHASFFFSVTLCIVVGTAAWAYAPDVHMRDWAQREAFLQLRRKEKYGEPRISPNYVDPDTVRLPTEDLLCDLEVII